MKMGLSYVDQFVEFMWKSFSEQYEAHALLDISGSFTYTYEHSAFSNITQSQQVPPEK